MIPIRDTIPSRNPPIVTSLLIAANVLVFIFELMLPEHRLQEFFYFFGIVPKRFTHPQWAQFVGFPIDDYWPFLTSMFLHGGWLHIIGNMWTLWIFGDNVEDRMGPLRFLIFYLLCGIAAGIVHVITNPESTIPTVGASGAIAGVMGAYLVLFPFSRVIVMVPIFFWPFFFELPAVTFLLIWYLTQLWSGTFALASVQDVGGVAWWAHVGGFVAGLVLHRFFCQPTVRRRRLQPDEWGLEGAWSGYRW